MVGIPLVELEVRSRPDDVALFRLFRTTPDGQSSLYMVGCYEDRIVKRSGNWLYASHKVIVDTRVLDTFTHVPV